MRKYELASRGIKTVNAAIVALVLVVASAGISWSTTTVGGRIDTDTTWTLANSPYNVTSTLQVYGDTSTTVTLTIETGVEVRFNSNVAMQIGNGTNKGALIAAGTSGSPITFTRDAATGSWGTVTFNDGTDDATTQLEYVNFQYGTGFYFYTSSPTFSNCSILDATSSYGMYMSSASPVLTNVALSSNTSYGIYLSNSSPLISGGSLTNANSTSHGIYGSGSPVISDYDITIIDTAAKYGIYLTSTTSSFSITNSTLGNGLYLSTTNITPSITGNTFTNSDSSPLHVGAQIVGDTLNNNTFTEMSSAGRIEVVAEVIKQDTLWKSWAAPYVLLGSVSIYNDATTTSTLTIEAGTEIRFKSGTTFYVGSGSYKGALVAQGTALLPITFTRDAVSGSWGNLVFYDGSDDVTTLLEYVNMDYSGGVYFYTASPTLKNCSVQNINSTSYGFYLSSSSPLLENVDISANASYGMYLSGSSPTITGGSLTNSHSSGHGIYGGNATSIDNYSISIVNTLGKYGFYVTTGTSDLSVTNSTVGNGIYINTINITPTITGNTFTNAGNSPVRVGANILGVVVSSNTFSGLTSAEKIEVVGEQVKDDASWPDLGAFYEVVSGNVLVYNDAITKSTLTIDPGVEIRFSSSSKIQVGTSTLKGALIAQGTPESRIKFTRSATTGNFPTTYIYNEADDATTIFEYVDIDYSKGFYIVSASPTIRNSTVTNVDGYYAFMLSTSNPLIENVDITVDHTYGINLSSSSPTISGGSLVNTQANSHGIYGSGSPLISDYDIQIVDSVGKYGYYASSLTSDMSLTNSTVGNGLYITTANIAPTITGNTFTNADTSPIRVGANIVGELVNNNTITGLTSAGKFEVIGEQVKDDATWPDLGAAYDVVSGAVHIYKDTTTKSTLTIEPGVEIRFSSGSYFKVGTSIHKGALIAQGTPVNRIKFTRSATTGNFPTTYIYNEADDATTIFEYVDIDYSRGFNITSASPTIRNCTVTNVDGYYAFYLSASNPLIENVDVSVDYNYGMYLSNSSPTITGGSLINTQANSHGIYGSGSPLISDYDIQIVDSVGKYGIYLSSTTSVFSLTNSSVQNGLYLTTIGISPTITGNIFSRSDSSPPHMGANIIIDVLANNTFLDLTSAGKIEMVGEKIDHDVIWSNLAAPYFISGTVSVYKSTTEASTLTINSGVEVKFALNARLEIGYSTSKGIIKALGTSAEPITMTRSGATGAWTGVYFNDGSDDVANVFENVDISYSNGLYFIMASPTLKNVNVSEGTSHGLYFNTSSPVLENVNVSTNYSYAAYLYRSSPEFQGGSLENLKSGGHGIYGFYSCSPIIADFTVNMVAAAGYYGIYLPTTTSSFSLTNSTIDNSLYIGSSSISPTISGNTFNGLDLSPLHLGASLIGSFVANNTLNDLTSAGYVELVGDTIKVDSTWGKLPAPYLLLSSTSVYDSLNPTSAPTLTIEPGVEVRFSQNVSLSIGHPLYSGILKAEGTAAEPILLTANHAAPWPGFWSGIILNSPAGYNSNIEFATIEYAGSGSSYSYAGIKIYYSSPTIRSVTIRQTKNTGIYISSTSARPLIESCDISGSTWGIYSTTSNPDIINNRIYNNTTAGVWNASVAAINARGNWWGDSSGPQHSNNPAGAGDAVNNNVEYNPWLSEIPNSDLSLIQPDVTPDELNPDGGMVTFSGVMSAPASWTILINDDTGATIKTFTGAGATIEQTWTGDTDLGGTVSNGIYPYTVDATNGTYSTAQVAGLIEATSDFTAEISTPTDNQLYLHGAWGTYIDVAGSADAISGFDNYKFAYGAGEAPTSWSDIFTSTQTVDDGPMFSWGIWNVTENSGSLRLTVSDTLGNSAVRIHRIRFLEVTSSNQTQDYISPNADGVQDELQVNVEYSYPVDWMLFVLDDQSAVVKTYNGSGATISQVWDGKDEQGLVVADGTYSYQIDATSSETGLQGNGVSGSVVVDSTPPVALVSAPLQDAVVFNDVVISGTADDVNLDTYRVELEPVGGGSSVVIDEVSTAVVTDELTTWRSNDATNNIPFANGDYLLWLIVTDKAGNNSSAIFPITLNNLQFFNVGATAHEIDTRQAEVSTISYDINAPAFVTLKIIPELQGPTGTPIYTDTEDCITAGSYSFLWDGTNSSGVAVADEAYLYVLEADDGVSTDVYAPEPPTGVGTVSCDQESSYFPYRNDPLTVTYGPDQASRVDVDILWAEWSYKVLVAKPHTAGSYIFDWDGRDPAGNILNGGGEASCSVASLLAENHIVTDGNAPGILSLEIDPFEFGLSFGQFTRIRYTLENDAVVTVRLIPPSGSSQIVLNGQPQTAGNHEVQWDALNSVDTNEKTFDVSVEGDYEVEVEAVNVLTGESSIIKGCLVVNR